MAIPIPQNVLNELNKELYRFIWNKNPDKVNRQDLCMDKQLGGLKMVNMFKFEISLKRKWIEKLVKHPSLP